MANIATCGLWLARWRGLRWLLLPLLAACASTHMDVSTETGNPPVIDVKKVALVVGPDGVHIVGQPGAVTPGGIEIQLAVVGAVTLVSGQAKPNGSFDLPISGSSEAVIELRAVAGTTRSAAVYVTRGGASVGTGQDVKQTCMQRSNLASQALAGVFADVDLSCQSEADCELVSNKTACTDSCADVLVSKGAVAGIETGVRDVDDKLCAGFAANGCSVIAQPCVPPPTGPVACVAGRCTQLREPAPTCPSCLDREVSWGPTNNMVTYTISDCNKFARSAPPTSSAVQACSGAVPHCDGSSLDSATIEALIVALTDEEVRRALSAGMIAGAALTPGGLSTRISVGNESFVIPSCSEPCSAIPPGLIALRDLLARFVSEVTCEPSCNANARYVKDTCLSCGATGGCAQLVGRCATVCSDASACAAEKGYSCSPRGICELTGCM